MEKHALCIYWWMLFFIISSFSIISCRNFHEVAWFNIITERKRPYRTALVQYNMYISYNTTNLFKTGAAGFSQTLQTLKLSQQMHDKSKSKRFCSKYVSDCLFIVGWPAVHYFKVKESSNNWSPIFFNSPH